MGRDRAFCNLLRNRGREEILSRDVQSNYGNLILYEENYYNETPCLCWTLVKFVAKFVNIIKCNYLKQKQRGKIKLIEGSWENCKGTAIALNAFLKMLEMIFCTFRRSPFEGISIKL